MNYPGESDARLRRPTGWVCWIQPNDRRVTGRAISRWFFARAEAAAQESGFPAKIVGTQAQGETLLGPQVADEIRLTRLAAKVPRG